ncbi:4Fe-4S binding protein [uncultured Ilyobacter sp.]|uniref:4Fe-4S binding protein n=1 Tax=uncultured Ilyobacter sp. TaxID=544433 RepID=UPI0029C65253|nr:4Fe-4S binding protein [uncultured Ilyobacter sp.]
MNKRKKLMKKLKFVRNYTWIYFLTMMILANYNRYFGLLGLASMLAPITLSSLGYGRVYCSHICDRGSFLSKIKYMNIERYSLPEKFQKKSVKFILLLFMIANFGRNLYLSKNLYDVGDSFFKMFLSSTILGILLGIIFKPRSWCQVCPMALIQDSIDKVVRKNRG